MLKLRQLQFKGIGRFVEEQTINFESLSSFVQVDGQNNNTGGSSGAGKSTIFQALEYLFGINKTPSTVLKTRGSEEPIYVQGTFECDGKPLVITRGKKLSIQWGDELTTGSSLLTEAKLDEIISIPRELFRPMLHKRQKEGGFFLNMGPADINDFLMSCLGLSHFNAKLEKLDSAVKTLSEKCDSLSSNFEASSASLKATEEAKLSLGEPPVKDVDQKTILELKAKAERSSAELQTTKSCHRLEVETLELSRPQVSHVPFDTSLREGYEKSLKETREAKAHVQLSERNRQVQLGEMIASRKADLSNLSGLVRAAETAKAEAVKLAQEVKKIRESLCPTCEQGWVADRAKDTEAAHLDRLRTLKGVMATGASATEQLPAAQADIDRWTADKAPRVPELQLTLQSKEQELETLISASKSEEADHRLSQNLLGKGALDEFASKQKAQRESHALALSQLSGQADLDRRAFDVAVGKLKAYDEARTRHEASATSLHQLSAYHRATAALAHSDLGKARAELAVTEELKRACKVYLSCSFDEALETISENATKLIRRVPNTANATIQIEAQKETQGGKVKEQVNAVIHMDGDENIDIRSLCGGERTAVDFAIDLSVIDLIESVANKGIDLFILDEPFNGLDTVCIEMALEVLKNSNTSKRLIIVDHNPEVKEMVESKLLVVRDGATSKVLQS